MSTDPTQPAEHIGGNAEDCPACSGTNPPYPFLCPATDHPSPEPLPDRAALRDRIAEALATADGWKWAPGFKEHSPTWQDYQRRADVVLAVLPPPTDRAAVLREAADIAASLNSDCQNCAVELEVAAELRRLAAEAQQTEWTCPTCGPVATEPHPRLPVSRCSNCKEHVPIETPEPAPDPQPVSAEFLHRLATAKVVPDDYEATTGHLVTCMAVAGGAVDPDCPCAAEVPTEEQVVREHVTTLHLIGEQLAGVENWLWQRLAEVRAAAPAVPVDAAADDGGSIHGESVAHIAGVADTADDEETRPPAACAGFPENCPNLRNVAPEPPRHAGGLRCGCNEQGARP